MEKFLLSKPWILISLLLWLSLILWKWMNEFIGWKSRIVFWLFCSIIWPLSIAFVSLEYFDFIVVLLSKYIMEYQSIIANFKKFQNFLIDPTRCLFSKNAHYWLGSLGWLLTQCKSFQGRQLAIMKLPAVKMVYSRES